MENPRAGVALLLLRVAAGAAMMHHGWSKIHNPLAWAGPTSQIPAFLQALAAVSEFFGGLGWVLGLLTPLASFGMACTMGYAVFKHAVERGDPFVGKGGSYELALLYLMMSLALLLTGPGRYSLDASVFRRR
jgi:putative oxidoreductase